MIIKKAYQNWQVQMVLQRFFQVTGLTENARILLWGKAKNCYNECSNRTKKSIACR